MIEPLLTSVGILPTIVLALSSIWLATVIYNVYVHPLRHIPGPKSWAISRLPFVRSFTRGTLITDLEVLHRRHGRAIRVSPNAVCFAHPDAWRDIQGPRTSNGGKPYTKDRAWWTSFASSSDSITTAIDHDKHARIRRMLAPGFTMKALKQQQPLLEKGVELLMQRFHEKVGADGRSEAFDIIPWFNFVAFDIFGEIGYSETFDCLETSNYHPFIRLIFDSLKANCFVVSIRLFPLASAVFKRYVFPYLMKKKQNTYATAVIDKVNRRMGWEVAKPDIMSYVIAGNEKGIMTPGEVQATFQTLTLAGSETTATSLSGIINQLIKYPETYEKLVDEIRGSLAKESDITLDAIKDLPYLNAAVNETFRLCPPTPFTLPRIVPKGGDTVCGTWVAGGTSVFILPWAVNHDPELWHDAASFRPERWLPDALHEDSEFYGDRRDALHPFGEGPRKCIGMHIAWAEIRLIVARLLWAFDFEAVGEVVQWESQKVFVLIGRDPLVVRLRERKFVE